MTDRDTQVIANHIKLSYHKIRGNAMTRSETEQCKKCEKDFPKSEIVGLNRKNLCLLCFGDSMKELGKLKKSMLNLLND